MQKLVVANWKSNKTVKESLSWAQDFIKACPKIHSRVQVVVAPTFPSLFAMNDLFETNSSPNLVLGAQDISPFPAGSYTGAVSSHNLKDLGVKYVILGHAERRKYFGETNQDVAKKVELALDMGMTPIVCLERQNIKDQASLIDKKMRQQCLASYDPSSAISTFETGASRKSADDVKQAVAEIKQEFGCKAAIYGGSVTETNVAEYMLVCDGALVGGASLDAKQFAELVQNSWVE
jgi:triosephosphate isomerase (TIM)